MHPDVNWGCLMDHPGFDGPAVTQKLINYCMELRPGFSCKIAYSSMQGSEHIVKMVAFNDDLKWLVRLPLPRHMNTDNETDRFASDWAARLRSEVATHGFVRERTNIPVPSIHGYDIGPKIIGWSFILMDYIPGKSAQEQLEKATPEQDTYLLEQMAAIQVKLANVRMGKIGSIFETSDGYVVGPDVETNRGPFTSPKEYYDAVATQRNRRCSLQRAESDELDAGDLPLFFSVCISAIPHDYVEEDFGLANRDLGLHNLIIDEEYEVVGLIDLDFIISAPIHVVANLPCGWHSELDVRSSNIGVAKRTKEYLNGLSVAGRQEFRDIVKTPLAGLWAILELLDSEIDLESLPWNEVRSILSFSVYKKSFV